MRQLNAFFFWASWACSTNRPGGEITYTNNWPSEGLIDNRPSGTIVVWSVDQLRGPAGGHRCPGVVLRRPARQTGRAAMSCRKRTRCWQLRPTPSMRATLKYFWVVTALILVADRPGRPDGALRRRGLGLLRHPAGQVAALLRDPHLAHPARHLLDRHRLAGHRAVHGPGRLGARAEVPAAGRQLPVRLPAGHRRRVDGGPVARRPAAAGQRDELLVRPPGLRVRGPGPVLAALPDGRPVPLAGC